MGYGNVVRVLRAYHCRISQGKDYQYPIATTPSTQYTSRSRASSCVTRQQNVASTETGAPVSLYAPERPSEISVPTGSCSVGYQPGSRDSKLHIIMVKLDVRN